MKTDSALAFIESRQFKKRIIERALWAGKVSDEKPDSHG